jgi:tetratricopeptide (TPR) repeat protein
MTAPEDTQPPAPKAILRYPRGEVAISLANGDVEGVEPALQLLTPGDAAQVLQAITAIGETFESQEDYPAAIKVYLAARDIARAHTTSPNVAVSEMNLGLAYKRNKEFERAEQAYQEALDLVRDPFDEPGMEAARSAVLANILLNQAILHFDRGKLEDSEQEADWCHALVEADHSPNAKAIAAQCELLRDRIRVARKPSPPTASLRIVDEGALRKR